ncbi:MAG: hypothetical protein ACRDZO_15110 [Egibacteraceae bacterium]
MTGSGGGWGWARIDGEIAAGGFDAAGFADELGIAVDEAQGFVRVRRALLAGRADHEAGGEGLTEGGLAAAGVRARDIVDFLRVSEAVKERARAGRCREGGIAM